MASEPQQLLSVKHRNPLNGAVMAQQLGCWITDQQVVGSSPSFNKSPVTLCAPGALYTGRPESLSEPG